MVSKAVMACLAAMALAAPLPAQEPGRPARAAIERRIRSGEIADLHAVLVIQRGQTVLEHYLTGPDNARGRDLGVVAFGPETLHDVRSVTKSIVALLFGIAVGDAAITSLDRPVLDYFPEYGDLQTPERRAITLRHLLTMTSGLHWDEETYNYADPRNSETAMDNAADRYRFVLSQPIDAAPGTRFNYSGGDVALIAAVLARATNRPIDLFAEERLFRPLGIARVEWHRDRDGVPIAASGLRMRPRDMARIGRMMLQQGRWQGRRVVPRRWAQATIRPQAQVEPDPACGLRYGYFWWLDPGCDATPARPRASAHGNGGQRIVLVPGQDLVIVTTAGFYNQPGRSPAINALVRDIAASLR